MHPIDQGKSKNKISLLKIKVCGKSTIILSRKIISSTWFYCQLIFQKVYFVIMNMPKFERIYLQLSNKISKWFLITFICYVKSAALKNSIIVIVLRTTQRVVTIFLLFAWEKGICHFCSFNHLSALIKNISSQAPNLKPGGFLKHWTLTQRKVNSFKKRTTNERLFIFVPLKTITEKITYL